MTKWRHIHFETLHMGYKNLGQRHTAPEEYNHYLSLLDLILIIHCYSLRWHEEEVMRIRHLDGKAKMLVSDFLQHHYDWLTFVWDPVWCMCWPPFESCINRTLIITSMELFTMFVLFTEHISSHPLTCSHSCSLIFYSTVHLTINWLSFEII